MHHYKWIIAMLCLMSSCNSSPEISVKETKTKAHPYALVIHGGAGTITRENLSPEKEKEYRAALSQALEIGLQALKDGGSSLDAVQKTINFMEDSPLFNAGKGAVFTHDKTNELDASIMFGKDQMAGAVGGVKTIKHPINAARAVMEKSKHVMMVGEGAEEFAAEQGLMLVDKEYFSTERRLKSIEKILLKEKSMGNMDADHDSKFGTVGCVALDKEGNISAGTSTGGMTNKRYNRIGDSPIIGAGTYADNATCGVSATGHGEYFIRYAVAHDISARMEYKSISLQKAAEEVIMKKLVDKGGSGGIVGLDSDGIPAMVFNSKGMYRGYANPDTLFVKIYKED